MPGARNTLAWIGAARTIVSASTRRLARSLVAAGRAVSSSKAPLASPYTPVVLMYTARLTRAPDAQRSRRVRGSRAPTAGGGARSIQRDDSPRRRARVDA